MTTIVITTARAPTLPALARIHPPGSLLLAVDGHAHRNGLTVRMPPRLRRILFTILAARGGLVSCDDLTSALYDDAEDGGALDARRIVHVSMCSVRDAAAALGFRIENRRGFGWCAVDLLTKRQTADRLPA